MKNTFEKQLDTLLAFEGKKSVLFIPAPNLVFIKEIQEKYQKLFGKVISREKVIVLLIEKGSPSLLEDLNKIETAIQG